MEQSDHEPDHDSRFRFFLERRMSKEYEEYFRSCKYELVRFEPYSSLRQRDHEEWVASFSFRGGSFDEAKFELVPGGWDHEHCEICNKRVENGDWYWKSSGPAEIDFCTECFPTIRDLLGLDLNQP